MKFSMLVFVALASTVAAENAEQAKNLRGHVIDEVLGEVRDLKEERVDAGARHLGKHKKGRKGGRKKGEKGVQNNAGGAQNNAGDDCHDLAGKCNDVNRAGGTSTARIANRNNACGETQSDGSPKKPAIPMKEIEETIEQTESYCTKDDECAVSCCCWTNGGIFNIDGDLTRVCLDISDGTDPGATGGCVDQDVPVPAGTGGL